MLTLYAHHSHLLHPLLMSRWNDFHFAKDVECTKPEFVMPERVCVFSRSYLLFTDHV